MKLRHMYLAVFSVLALVVGKWVITLVFGVGGMPQVKNFLIECSLLKPSNYMIWVCSSAAATKIYGIKVIP